MSSNTEYDDFYDRADQFVQDKRYEEAIVLYQKLAELNPGDDSLIMSMACAYRDNGDLNNAVQCLERLLEKELAREVFTGFAYDELVRILREMGEHEKLIDLCERVAAAQPDECALLATLGESCIRGGRVQRAAQVFKALTLMEPESAPYWLHLGNALIADGDFAGAEEAYERALIIDSEETDSFYFRMADAYIGAGELQRAEDALKKSIAANGANPLYHCSLGDLYLKEGKPAEGQACYDHAVAIDPSSKAVYCNRLGNSLLAEGFISEAVEAFEKAIAEDPETPFYYLGILRACEKGGLDAKAREIYEKAKERNVFN